MKEVWHQWRGYISDLTPKSVLAVMTETRPGAPDELFRLRRNKIRREDRPWLQEGAYLTMRVGRNGNGKPQCVVSLSKRVWSREEILRAKERAKEFVELFSVGAGAIGDENAG